MKELFRNIIPNLSSFKGSRFAQNEVASICITIQSKITNHLRYNSMRSILFEMQTHKSSSEQFFVSMLAENVGGFQLLHNHQGALIRVPYVYLQLFPWIGRYIICTPEKNIISLCGIILTVASWNCLPRTTPCNCNTTVCSIAFSRVYFPVSEICFLNYLKVIPIILI